MHQKTTDPLSPPPNVHDSPPASPPPPPLPEDQPPQSPQSPQSPQQEQQEPEQQPPPPQSPPQLAAPASPPQPPASPPVVAAFPVAVSLAASPPSSPRAADVIGAAASSVAAAPAVPSPQAAGVVVVAPAAGAAPPVQHGAWMTLPDVRRMAAAEVGALKDLFWGTSSSTFSRWSPGFQFSDVEPTALVQHEGGPCAVLAPVQAYVLQRLLAGCATDVHWDRERLAAISRVRCDQLLVQALSAILERCRASPDAPIRLVKLLRRSEAQRQRPAASAVGAAANVEPNASGVSAEPLVNEHYDPAQPYPEDSDQLGGWWQPSYEDLHERLGCIELRSMEEVSEWLSAHLGMLKRNYGVLLFVYAVLLTKGLERVEQELQDVGVSLVQEPHGHGGQGLINLLLTGKAVPHVFDNDENVGGLVLKGIESQPDVGYMSYMEQLRMISVGSYLKNPRFPVWILASDTHLTVLFSSERRLTPAETPAEAGLRVFGAFDTDGGNFIKKTVLAEVLQQLGLCSDTDYVTLMADRLDADQFGVIMLKDFMEEFYGNYHRQPPPDTFDVLHYNGLTMSNGSAGVRYFLGHACLLETDLKEMCDPKNMIQSTLQTKWPNIDVVWEKRDELDREAPTLN